MPKKLKVTILRDKKQREETSFQVKFKSTKVHQNSFFPKNSKLDGSHLRKLKKLIKSIGIEHMEAENYLSSSLDQPELVKVMPVNLLKEFGGQGLYAYVDIPAGTCLGEYTGELYPTTTLFKKYVKQTSGADWSYAMTLGHKVIDGKDKGNFTRYINFSDTQANVEFREDIVNGIKCVKVITTKDIPKGKQVLVDYNCYDERASKEYFFLSPEDNWQSAQEVLASNSRVYRLCVMHAALTLLNLKENDSLYVTKIGEVILSGKQLSLDQKKVIQDDINLPFLKTNSKGEVLDFNHADSFTALMLASYLGQVENVKWLLTNHANIDQQQNISGNCALFFALAGYAASETKNQQRAYMDVLSILIDSQANILVHDREDRTFLHKAIETLSLSDFKVLMSHISVQKQFNSEEVLSYIDKNNQDIFLYCLANKDFDKASVLLGFCSDFFSSDYFNYGSKHDEKIGKGILINIINEFDRDEKGALLKLLTNPKLKLDSDFLSSLGLSNDGDLSFSQ
ncbi:SET domain-containing protein-lysine N-methyltransferase [Fluoribacter gormanii]|uniref:Ankyrin repeat-containing protein n=1 Tax=Fluoribacter gormanii TaxID=464 RepID=A0A377GJ54_9GAMM|nr:Dot/Icm T4SS effector AnkI/LegAS4 [Fluoribacter gormanii]KTD03565.1 eukaryotic huntingtin interacting protein B [Fluoribacter gormanii]MCW8472280.1 SET domain-containing protein-lysine N-methyltransferase [Fluoribacter gormanii]SIQ42816.1 Ankyrin repeat-containing protein [Fluoribacter gormanii]STO24593.1 SET domain [Fluoribacter gormanii]